MNTTNKTITTDNADLIAYHAALSNQIPSLYMDTLTHRVVADVTADSLEAFRADATLQRYLSIKRSVWHEIALMRGGKQ